MKDKYNFNHAMIKALHSFLWYEGLLDCVEDEYIDYDKSGNVMPEGSSARTPGYWFSVPKYEKNCAIIRLIDDIRNKKTEYSSYTVLDAEKVLGEREIYARYSMLWQMLVEMFGECGTSPRTGWIEKRKECADFLDMVVHFEELNHKGELD